jgi:hypothetical protein
MKSIQRQHTAPAPGLIASPTERSHRGVHPADPGGAGERGVASFLRREEGLEVVEWLLVLGGVIVPFAALIYKVMQMVAQFYSFNSWTISLPFI